MKKMILCAVLAITMIAAAGCSKKSGDGEPEKFGAESVQPRIMTEQTAKLLELKNNVCEFVDSIGTPKDVIYYKLNVDPTKEWNIRVSLLDRSGKSHFHLTGSVIGDFKRDKGYGRLQTNAKVPQWGEYYVIRKMNTVYFKITPNTGTTGTYFFRVELSDYNTTADQYEPNNTPEKAFDLTGIFDFNKKTDDKAVLAQMKYAGGSSVADDYYKINLPRGHQYKVTLQVPGCKNEMGINAYGSDFSINNEQYADEGVWYQELTSYTGGMLTIYCFPESTPDLPGHYLLHIKIEKLN